MAIMTIPHNPTYTGLLDLKVNIPFLEVDGETLCLQLIKPQWASGDGKGFPLVVFIQGSAWTKPNQFWELPQLSQLAAKGFVIASVTHRSCFEAAAPAFLQDVKAAIRFLRKNAAEYDIDKTRVCAFGTSSGGNTALLLGLTGDDPAFETAEHAGESTAVQAVVDCFGPADLVRMTERWKDFPLSDDNLIYALGGRNPETYRDTLATISPVNYVTPGRTLPPFLLLHGDADTVVAYSDSERMYQLLTANGYQADLVRVTDAPHEGSFWSQPLLEIIFGFILRHLS
ncbi:MAG: alpha/beta hydrolase [Clostridiales bacterium]|nr:alpha/beta hydrolase [Clostridiales bacterium]